MIQGLCPRFFLAYLIIPKPNIGGYLEPSHLHPNNHGMSIKLEKNISIFKMPFGSIVNVHKF